MSESWEIGEESLLPLLIHAFDGVALATMDPCRLTFVNPVLASLIGRRADELRGESLLELFAAQSHDELIGQIDRVRRGITISADLVAYLCNDDAGLRPMDVRVCRLTVGDMPLLGFVMRCVGELAYSSAVPAARRDSLTNLPDRGFLLARLATLLKGDRTADRQFAVLFIDLDNFKQINDGYGHLLGDRVLREVAGRLGKCVREGDHVTRYGGDEFVVLLENVIGRNEIDPVLARIDCVLAEPIVLPEGEFVLSVSTGVAQAAANHRSPEDVLQEADRAMYSAKRAPTG